MSAVNCALTAIVTMVAIAHIAWTDTPIAHAQQAGDRRQKIELDARERAFVLSEMRTFLESVEGIVSAVAGDRVTEAATAASKSGMTIMHEVPPALRQKLPMEFKKLGHATHQAFDALAVESKSMGDGRVVLKQARDDSPKLQQMPRILPPVGKIVLPGPSNAASNEPQCCLSPT